MKKIISLILSVTMLASAAQLYASADITPEAVQSQTVQETNTQSTTQETTETEQSVGSESNTDIAESGSASTYTSAESSLSTESGKIKSAVSAVFKGENADEEQDGKLATVNSAMLTADSAVNLGDDFFAYISYTGYNNAVRYVTAKSTDNNNVALYSYIENNTSSDQIWHFIRQSEGSYKIINADNGLCLSAGEPVGDLEPYGNVVVKDEIKDGINASSQHWYIYSHESKYVFVPASYLQAALDADNGTETSFAEGINVHLWSNSLSGTRIFSINILLTLADVGDVFYATIGFRDNMDVCVDLRNDLDNVIIYPHTINNDHTWLFSKNTDGSYSIKNAYNGKYLNATGDSDGAKINLSETNDSNSQKWDIYINNNYSSQDNKYAFSPRSSNSRIMDIAGNVAAEYTKVDLYNFSQYGTGNTAQIFSIDIIETLPKIEPQESEITPVTSDAIKFQLFDYGDYINHTDGVAGTDNWRAVSPYFSFVSENTDFTSTIWDANEPNYDEDRFAPNHASVESKLYKNYPVIDLTKNAYGEKKGDGTNHGLDSDARCLGYLFGSEPNNSAVKYYYPKNTILQTYDNKGVNHYYYNSTANVNDSVTTEKANAVDYDYANNEFRIRSYTETGTNYPNWSSFFPFNSTYNTTANTDGNREIETNSIDFWYGMRMDVDFIQSADGKMTLNDGTTEDMVFNFTGDDDIWVFIDDVLVLDLGGRHIAVNGSINFATGEVKASIDNEGTDNDYSYPTTLKEMFGTIEPNGGWDGNTFADYSSHKLSLFYLERAQGMSTCCIDFNMPTMPNGSLAVAKDVVSSKDEDLNSKDDTKYTFRLSRHSTDSTESDITTTELKNYTKYKKDGTTETGNGTVTLVSDSNDYYEFTLQGKESIYFPDLDENLTYKIEEITDGQAYSNYLKSTSVAVDDGTQTTATSTIITPTGETQTVKFTNTIQTLDINLNYYDRTVVNGKPADISKDPTVITQKYVGAEIYNEDGTRKTISKMIVDSAVAADSKKPIDNIIDTYSIWGTQENAVNTLKTFYNFHTKEKYVGTGYHTDCYGNEPDSGDKWITYFDANGGEIEDESTATANPQNVYSVNVWLYNKPKAYSVTAYQASSFSDLEQSGDLYVAKSDLPGDTNKFTDTAYYNQRLGKEYSPTADGSTNHLAQYGISGYTGNSLSTAEKITMDANTTLTFSHWAFDEDGKEVASTDIKYNYRITNEIKLYAVYASSRNENPGLTVSKNNPDVFVDTNGISKTRLNTMMNPYNCDDCDKNISQASIIYVLFNQKDDLSKLNNIDSVTGKTYLDILREDIKGILDKGDTLGKVTVINVKDVTATGFKYDVQSADGDKDSKTYIKLTNKNRLQFSTTFTTSALSGKRLLAFAGMKYNDTYKDAEGNNKPYNWIVSDNYIDYNYLNS